MPSFAFWKSSKVDEATAPLLTDDAHTDADESSVVETIAVKNLDLNPGNESSGVFLFDEEDLPPQSPPTSLQEDISSVAALEDVPPSTSRDIEAREDAETNNKGSLESAPEIEGEGELASSPSTTDRNPPSLPPTSSPENESLLPDPAVMSHMSTTDEDTEPSQQIQEAFPRLPEPMSQPQRQTSTTKRISAEPAAALDHHTMELHDRDSGVELSDDGSIKAPSRPAFLAMSDSTQRSRNSSLSIKHTSPARPSPALQRTDSTPHRLHRPTELNLGANPVAATSKPRSELEKRYDLIRNSRTQSKATLRSPTELLKDRLNMSPRKEKMEEKIHVFMPPRSIANGCWLPGPGARMDAFTSTSVRAQTEAGGRPAWWCKFDKLVVFDGIDVQDNGELKIHTRTSKGLSIARRRGDMETIVIPMDCAHCQEMLNRSEWKYDLRVCKRSVCWDCKERCKWEVEEEKRVLVSKSSDESTIAKADGNRYRADSVLQDEQDQGGELIQKAGVEQDRLNTPIEVMSGIEQILESVET
jgi:hypothetical protein